MEGHLAGVESKQVAHLLALYRGPVPRFEKDLAALHRDALLAKASALMLAQAAVEARGAP